MSEEKNKKPDDKVKSDPLLMYIGDDVGFWKSFLSDVSNAYKAFKFRSDHKFGKDTSEIQSLVKVLTNEAPKVIFFDISKNPEDLLHLVRIMVRMNSLEKPAMIGLVDITTDRSYIRTALMAGLEIIHIKTSETEAIIQATMCMGFPAKLEEHGFVMAQISDEVGAFFPAKIGYINVKGLGIESNFPIAKGQPYLLHNWLTEKDIIGSPGMRAVTTTQTDLYYNFDNAHFLNFDFAPAVIPSPDMSAEALEKKKIETQSMLERSIAGVEEWINKNCDRSSPKNLKVLVIDKTMAMYDNQPKADNYDFVLRCQPFLKYPKKELLRNFPHLIVFEMEEVSAEDLEGNEEISYSFNDSKTLQYIINTITSIKDYSPYIIVFNGQGHDTASLQNAFKYSQMVAYREHISPELMIKMIEILKNKLGDKIEKMGPENIILNKAMLETYAEYEFAIKINAITEMDLYFTSELEMVEGDTFRITVPAPMLVTVAARPKNAKITQGYYGLIHGIGEDKRMVLRKFINSVFFRNLEQQKLAEKEEVEKLKQQFISTKKKEEEEAANQRREELENERQAKLSEASNADDISESDLEDQDQDKE